MAYDAELAQRIRALLKKKKNFNRKEMFGGVGHLVNSNTCEGPHKHYRIVKFNSQQPDELMEMQGAKPFDITGPPIPGGPLARQVHLAKSLQMVRCCAELRQKSATKKINVAKWRC